MRPFLRVYGHIAIDQIMSLRRFPDPNSSVDVVKRTAFGGTGANIATFAAALGVPTVLHSYVGPDLPDSFLELMESKGVDLSGVIEAEGYETSSVIIVNDEKQNQVAYVHQGPMQDMIALGFDDIPLEMADHVHVSTGRPEAYLPMMRRYRKMGAKVSFDPAQETYRVWRRETFDRALANSTTYFCNKSEMKVALEYQGVSGPERLLETVPRVICTLGKNGSVMYDEHGSHKVPAAKPESVADPTGAGDAFRGGYYAGLYRGHDPIRSMAYGAAAASFAIEAVGPLTRIPTWQEVEERARDVIETPKIA